MKSFREILRTKRTGPDEGERWRDLAGRYRQHLPDLYRKPGELIDRNLEVCDVLGYGPVTVTYLVYDRRRNRSYVAKTLRNDQLRDDAAKKRFRRAADVWLRIGKHPFIASAAELLEVRPRTYLLVEHVAGPEGRCSLADRLDRRPPTLAESLRWALQLCAGMEHAHRSGIGSHGDLAPQNLLIDERGALRIDDFGLGRVAAEARTLPAVVVTSRAGRATLSRQRLEGAGAGTPTHMAPEQFTNAAKADERSDVYSAGVVLYQLAANGALPFEEALPTDGEDPAERLREQMRYWRRMQMAHSLRPLPALESPMFPIIVRCLAKNPRDRYQSFGALRAELTALAARLFGARFVDESLAGEPADETLRCGLGLIAAGRAREALDLLVAETPEAASAAAQAHRVLGEHAEALRRADRALELKLETPAAWRERGLALEAIGDLDEAAVSYERATLLDPNDAISWNNRGLAQMGADRLEDALYAFERAVSADAASAVAWHNYGACLFRLGQLDEAAEAFERSLRSQPGDTIVHFYRGLCNVGLARWEAATEDFDQALAGDAGIVDAWLNRAHCLNELGRYAEAAESYGRAIALQPGDSRLWFEKAAAEAQAGLAEQAQASFEKHIALAA